MPESLPVAQEAGQNPPSVSPFHCGASSWESTQVRLIVSLGHPDLNAADTRITLSGLGLGWTATLADNLPQLQDLRKKTMLLKRKERERVRDIARNHYRWHTADLQAVSKREPVSFLMKGALADRRLIMRNGIEEDLKSGFGTGIISSILISIAIKLAMRYVNQWIEENLFGYDVPSTFSEAKKR